jgi:hypothetical protein
MKRYPLSEVDHVLTSFEPIPGDPDVDWNDGLLIYYKDTGGGYRWTALQGDLLINDYDADLVRDRRANTFRWEAVKITDTDNNNRKRNHGSREVR